VSSERGYNRPGTPGLKCIISLDYKISAALNSIHKHPPGLQPSPFLRKGEFFFIPPAKRRWKTPHLFLLSPAIRRGKTPSFFYSLLRYEGGKHQAHFYFLLRYEGGKHHAHFYFLLRYEVGKHRALFYSPFGTKGESAQRRGMKTSLLVLLL
jgi:hypothetical protein